MAVAKKFNNDNQSYFGFRRREAKRPHFSRNCGIQSNNGRRTGIFSTLLPRSAHQNFQCCLNIPEFHINPINGWYFPQWWNPKNLIQAVGIRTPKFTFSVEAVCICTSIFLIQLASACNFCLILARTFLALIVQQGFLPVKEIRRFYSKFSGVTTTTAFFQGNKHQRSLFAVYHEFPSPTTQIPYNTK